jgi:uncharacterized protein (TIGR03083 family)
VKSLGPIYTVDLFPDLNSQLLALLHSLSDGEWSALTVCAAWSVKDLAAHLLGDELGNVSRRRDRFGDTSLLQPGEDLSRWEDLVRYLNRYNEAWVAATRRLSPRILCELLDDAAREFHEYVSSLDPDVIGGPVSWAGPDPAPVWLDIAREYTERWLHQQQVRDATGRPPLYEPRLFAPVLDTFVRALPHTYRDVEAIDGMSVRLVIDGEAGGTWRLARDGGRWLLVSDETGAADASVTMRQDTAWRLFTKGITPEEASGLVTLAGDRALAAKVLQTVSIIA